MIKFGNISKYVTDDSLESEGVELDFDGFFITIRRAGGSNIAFQSKMAEIIDSQGKDVSGKIRKVEDDKQVLYSLFANYIVVGWRGLKDEKGKEIPFSPKNCIDLFNSSDEIYIHVSTQSTQLNNFRNEKVEQSGNE